MSARVCHCGRITTNKRACETCLKKYAPKPRRKSAPPRKVNSTKAGYGSDWQRLRESYLSEVPLCEICDEKGFVTPAVEVHHKVTIAEDPSLRLDWDNLQALCVPCHRKLHNDMRGFHGYSRQKTYGNRSR